MSGMLVALSLLAGGCSGCDEFYAYDGWETEIVGRAEAAPLSPAATEPAASQGCAIAEVAGKGRSDPGTAVDPNLLELARLELERDCYRARAERLRRRLDALQDQSINLK